MMTFQLNYIDYPNKFPFISYYSVNRFDQRLDDLKKNYDATPCQMGGTEAIIL